MSWDDSDDYSDGFWVSDSRGARTDPSWTASDIDTNADGAYDVHVADMDNDGDMDIISASYTDDTIAWYENDGAADPGWSAENIVTNVDGAIDVHVADMDNDGDLDIVSASDNDEIIAWYENDGATNPSWSKSNIYYGDDEWPSRVYIGDMDGDGDMDILSVSYNDDTIAWYENDGNVNPSWSASDIDTNADGAYDVFAADMDGDGDMDILSASRLDDTIAWYENDGASNPSWTASDIATDADGATSVFAADMDNDGDMDILSASTEDDTIAWYENNNGDGSSWTASDIDTNADYAESVFAADMDNDGDMDIVSASAIDDTIAWYENDGASDPSWTASDIATSADYATSVFAADMDNDGDMDIVSASWNDDTIAWYENTATFSFTPSWTSRSVTTSLDGPNSVHAADLDNDGDLDIVASINRDNRVVWYENDGSPSDGGWTYHLVKDYSDPPSYQSGMEYVHVADIDDDGDLDILAARGGSSEAGVSDAILYFVNDGTPSNGGWSTKTIVSGDSDADGAFRVKAADIDSDGDLDIVANFMMVSKITWFENDGSPNSGSWTGHDLFDDDQYRYSSDIEVADIDGDGDLDVIEAAQDSNKIFWFENDGTPETNDDDDYWTSTKIKGGFSAAYDVAAADIDNDGDMDVIGAAYTGDKVSWFENDGTPGGINWDTHDIGTPNGPLSLVTVDFDYDGDIDVLSVAAVGDKIKLFVNDGTPDDGWTTKGVAASVDKPSNIFVADINQDGYLDVVAAILNDDEINWYETSAIPEFSNIMMPIASVLAIIAFRRR
jgi:hypothetical protein